MAELDPKSHGMLSAIDLLLGLHAHESPALARAARHFRGTFHEELATPPARPISKKSRAKANAEKAKPIEQKHAA